jgi:hypothetical protein
MASITFNQQRLEATMAPFKKSLSEPSPFGLDEGLLEVQEGIKVTEEVQEGTTRRGKRCLVYGSMTGLKPLPATDMQSCKSNCHCMSRVSYQPRAGRSLSPPYTIDANP